MNLFYLFLSLICVAQLNGSVVERSEHAMMSSSEQLRQYEDKLRIARRLAKMAGRDAQRLMTRDLVQYRQKLRERDRWLERVQMLELKIKNLKNGD